MKPPRIFPQTQLLLDQFLHRPRAWRYGYELSRETNLKSGTLYPILMRLAKHKFLETKWVVTQEGVPPRHSYRLTSKGLAVARSSTANALSPAKIRRPAFSGGTA
jgi:DNA-binding PadR family transcriptional regulator